LLVAGAVGVVGFAIVYFLDPQEGPRRRRRVLNALQDAAYETLRRSQQLVDRLSEPAAAEPSWREPQPHPLPQPLPQREWTPQPQREWTPSPARSEDDDLAETLRDEVSIFRVEPEAEEAAVPVGVGGPAEDRFEPEPPAARGGSERVSYVHSVTAPPTPRPTVVSYDREPAEERVVRDVDASTTRPRTGSRRGALIGAAAAVVLLGAAAVGAWAVWGGDEGTKSAAPLSSGAAQALQLISQPGARSVSVAGSEKMVLVVTPSGRAALIISGLTAAPKGKEYQAWIIVGKQPPSSAGLFKGGNTRLVIPLAQKLPKGAIFAVTVERAGGAPAPTQKPKFTAKIY
jgi:anti-sigma-K factor RskA